MTDSRYPYTYSCDFIRSLGPVSTGGVVLSRSDASQIHQGIAQALGIEDDELARKLADAQLENQSDPAEAKRQAERLLLACGYAQ